MPDRTSVLIFVGLVGGSLAITLATMPDKMMVPVLIALFAGVGLVVSPDHSYVPLWKRSPVVWRVPPGIFVVFIGLVAPPIGGLLVGRLLLGMIALSMAIMLLALAHLVLGERFGLYDSDDG